MWFFFYTIYIYIGIYTHKYIYIHIQTAWFQSMHEQQSFSTRNFLTIWGQMAWTFWLEWRWLCISSKTATDRDLLYITSVCVVIISIFSYTYLYIHFNEMSSQPEDDKRSDWKHGNWKEDDRLASRQKLQHTEISFHVQCESYLCLYIHIEQQSFSTRNILTIWGWQPFWLEARRLEGGWSPCISSKTAARRD